MLESHEAARALAYLIDDPWEYRTVLWGNGGFTGDAWLVRVVTVQENGISLHMRCRPVGCLGPRLELQDVMELVPSLVVQNKPPPTFETFFLYRRRPSPAWTIAEDRWAR